MDSNEDIVIYPKLGKLLVLSAVFVLIGLALTYFGLMGEDNEPFIVIIDVLCTVIFGLCLVYYVARIKNKKPSLIVNDEGITDQSSYIEAGVIRWEEVKNIEIYSLMNQRMIGIKLYHPEEFMSKQRGFKKMLMRANQGMVDTPINIAESGLPMSLDKVYLIMLKKWKQSRREAPENNIGL